MSIVISRRKKIEVSGKRERRSVSFPDVFVSQNWGGGRGVISLLYATYVNQRRNLINQTCVSFKEGKNYVIFARKTIISLCASSAMNTYIHSSILFNSLSKEAEPISEFPSRRGGKRKELKYGWLRREAERVHS